MPIPAAPDELLTITSATLTLFRQLHDQLRDELAELDDAGLNWVSGQEMNTIATIVTHVLGSEAETLRCLAGLDCPRDRDAEFRIGAQARRSALERLAEADEGLRQLEPLITEERLVAEFPLPTLPTDEVRPGMTWLIGNYGHAREHLGQVQLTKQLYVQARG